ncbi:hypothetical protein ACFVNB_31205 [Streptomyces rochei]|uniref:hypothetical protein n=1 Tax=Streptomyces rochei TaxID=1928 RepID=UPI0036AE5002
MNVQSKEPCDARVSWFEMMARCLFVRTAVLERCFRCVVRLHRDDGTWDRATLLRDLSDSLALDKELHLEPGFFAALPAVFPRITAVDLQIKEGRAHNELTRYRYDVVLPPPLPFPWLRNGASGLRVRNDFPSCCS